MLATVPLCGIIGTTTATMLGTVFGFFSNKGGFSRSSSKGEVAQLTRMPTMDWNNVACS